ncbi:uncharacterized protein K460DRAFT_363071 [Cucurbitaria berberidis CBS 394.84]|uniref:Uncharacterized protein n=1 Tax=Cucurbitaria berberidis CBS 394.84 TaxID=1168544 RepID=A0A9P4L9E8_9PLEO|nr:uncharacterized protein K460DRAFT_363071 [Cucurbitaria berberidis CBS 394.84]KAF1846950.1 hypothetical protein K460DRAFT_363071 [Cucurbitaria berberidis CBS 394.84]
MASKSSSTPEQGGIVITALAEHVSHGGHFLSCLTPDYMGDNAEGSDLKIDLQDLEVVSMGAWIPTDTFNVDEYDLEAYPYDYTVRELNNTPPASTEEAHSLESTIVIRLSLLILCICENDGARALFATEYTCEAVVEAQENASNATTEGAANVEN